MVQAQIQVQPQSVAWFALAAGLVGGVPLRPSFVRGWVEVDGLVQWVAKLTILRNPINTFELRTE